jgi:serine/threonine-protein kinase
MSDQPAAPRLAVLVFTDVVKSVPLKSRMGDAAAAAIMSRHDGIFRASFAAIPRAKILQDTGDGFLLRFETASDAVAFALRLQHAISREDWKGQAIAVRVGIHLGEVWEVDSLEKGFQKLFGLAVDMTARVMSLALGGQILMTRPVFDSARQNIRQHPDAVAPESLLLRWMAHGPYRLSGSDEPMEICEVGVEGISPLQVPPDTANAKRALASGDEVMFGWRPGIGLEIPDRPGWQLDRKIGTGGFGEVWLASNRKLRQQRVFKFCFDADRLRSLKRELTLFRVLREVLGDRPDIARLQGINLDHAPFFLESDYTPGGDLTEWSAARGGIATVPLSQRLQLFARSADAVAAAHSVGVLHKDIKPSNILIYVDEEGTARPRLCDFGIGMIDDVARLHGRNITVTGFTQITSDGSSRSGTPMYAPPELLAGRPYTVKGDVYALGVLLYQLVVADLDRPLAAGWERDVTDPLLRQDIAESVDGDPQRRPASAEEFSRRITSLETRRQALTQAEKTRKRVARMHLMQRLFVFVSLCGITLTAAVIYVNLRIATERDFAVAARTQKELERQDAVRLRGEAPLRLGRRLRPGRFCIAFQVGSSRPKSAFDGASSAFHVHAGAERRREA